MTPVRPLLPRCIGEIVAELLAQRQKRDRAKHFERRWDVEPCTAANAVKGHIGIRTLATAARVEGWSFWMALGSALIGEDYSDWLERSVAEAWRHAEQLEADARSAADLRARFAALQVGRDAEPDWQSPDADGDR